MKKKRMSPTFVIAEAGVNHNGSLKVAQRLVEAAHEADANAVKFQMFKTEDLLTPKTKKAAYQKKTVRGAPTQMKMLKKLELSGTDFAKLLAYCRYVGIEFMCTPFDIESLRFLAEKLGAERFKISSGDVTNALLLFKTASYGKPVILSTGMSTLKEIQEALGVLAFAYTKNEHRPGLERFRRAFLSSTGQKALKERVTLLHCVTEYPAPFDEINLRAIDQLRDTFELAIGFSDHTSGIATSIAAVARGAVLIEKHLTLSRGFSGPDHQASLEPDEFHAMVEGIRQVERALGSGEKRPTRSEVKNIPVARRSVVAACTIQKNEPFTEKNITVKRPALGLNPFYYWELLGKNSKKTYKTNDFITR